LHFDRAGVQQQVQSEEKTIGLSESLPEIVSGQDDCDYENFSANEDKLSAKSDGNEVNYDSDGLPVSDKTSGEKSRIEPLPIVDHSAITYCQFKRNFYSESSESSKMTEIELALLREELEVSVQGSNVPKPMTSFQSLPLALLKEITKVGFEKPTSIQAQALPIALSGRDLIGLAKTGSGTTSLLSRYDIPSSLYSLPNCTISIIGKTLAYVWPLIVHILDQPQMKIGDGPIGVILSPTRELAAQIHTEAKKFAKVFNMRVCAVFGGGGKWEMVKALKEAPEMVVATPGRFIELIRSKATNLSRCTMVVLDEADRMFEMGFEYQMRSIVNNIRPDRQTLLFSATMKRKVEGFARELLKDPIRIVVGTVGQANPDIRQVISCHD
jgi:ATP-dependent RNA helicase DDX42